MHGRLGRQTDGQEDAVVVGDRRTDGPCREDSVHSSGALAGSLKANACRQAGRQTHASYESLQPTYVLRCNLVALMKGLAMATDVIVLPVLLE
jgi:hypothetical protein